MARLSLGLLLASVLACGETTTDNGNGPEAAAGSGGSASGGSGGLSGSAASASGGLSSGAGGASGASASGGSSSGMPCTQLSCLAGARFLYQVRGLWDREQDASPIGPIPPSAFLPVDGPPVLVDVSEDGRIVTLDAWLIETEMGDLVRSEQAVYGKLERGLPLERSLPSAWFSINLGVGARFVVQEEAGALWAECSLLGSGVPVTHATRGTLTHMP